MRSQSFVITGMTCANCVNTVSKALNQSDKIQEASVNLATEKAKVLADDTFSDDEIIQLVEAVGYGAIVNDQAHQEKIAQEAAKRAKRLRWFFVCSAILTLPLIVGMIMDLLQIHALMFLHLPLFQLILATPVQFVIGARFYSGAFHALKNKAANMDVLVALGTTVAYLSSVILAVILHQKNALNFESSMVIITLVLMGKLLEQRAKERTTNAITGLMETRAQRVHTTSGDLPIEEAKVGQVIQIFAGEKVPLDGKILAGTASFDESLLTGESLPLVKNAGDVIFEGAINLDGEMKVEVVHELENSTISRMVEMMSEAQSTKPEVQKLADQISTIFVPVVLGVACLTFLLTWLLTGVLLTAIMHAVATLVIACPCALGLATPTAIISGTGLAAKHGLLIKNANALELASHVQTIFFDKTGTITTGEFNLATFDGDDEDYRILASLEAHSRHPLARSLVFDGDLYDLTGLSERAGQGLSAWIGQTQYFAGNAKMMGERGISVCPTVDTVIYLADREHLRATATFRSVIKDEAVQTIQQLKNRGFKTIMLTGDNQVSAEKIQREVQLDEVKAELSPSDKAEMVQKTKQSMMVGDGINDAIALAASSVGVAMATGSDIAMEAGDITIIGGKLHKLVAIFDISQKTMLKIKQNYFWAFFYNVIGIPLAAFGLLNPMVAAAAMSLSSVSVILNSLILTKAKIKA